jgi:hypothetical protein
VNIDLVFAASTCTTADAHGVLVRLTANEPWAANDPLVLARPGLFVAVPPSIRRTVAAPPVIKVEKATKAPGEKRA